jgi:hypothetical protein
MNMGIGYLQRSKWISGIILSILCCGMIFGEIHDPLGHTHSVSSNPITPFEFSKASGLQLISLDGNHNDSSCSLCYLNKLLGQSLIPQIDCLFDSSFAVRAVPIQPLCLVQTNTVKEGNRDPPRA